MASGRRGDGPFGGGGEEGPSLWKMMRIVAISVAVIILVSFAAGYLFGRLFV